MAEDWDKMITVAQNRTIICDGRVCMSVSRRVSRLLCGAGGAGARGVGGRGYNRRMDKSRDTTRRTRRAAWWCAFAALAGFLLADLA